MVSFAANIKTIYLALVDEKANVGYFFEHKLIKPSLSIKIKPVVNFRLFLSSA